MTEELEDEQIEALLDDLKRKVERLRVTYEQYFLGIEKVPPLQQRRDVVRDVHRLTQLRIKRAALKFRFQSLVQRFNAHKAYWTRTEREIEMGTHKRQTFRAKKRESRDSDVLASEDWLAINAIRSRDGDEAAEQAQAERIAAREREARERRAAAQREKQDEDAAAAEFLRSMGVDAGPEPSAKKASAETVRGVSAEHVAERAAKLKALRAKLRNAPGSAGGPTDGDRALYDRLVAAKRKLNQSTDTLDYDKVQRSLEAQRKKLAAKHQGKRIDFDVVVKDGNAFLKPVAR
jgi:hypothetical protein